MSHLNIDELLSEEERIPVKFLVEGQSIGHLDANNESNDLPAQSRVEIPLWLSLGFLKKDMVKFELPKHFQKKMRDEIIAGAANINLKEFSFYFFEVGLKMAESMEDPDLRKHLLKAFAGDRFRDLMVHSLSSWNDEVSDYAQNLTNLESKIFKEGKQTSRDLHDWRIKRASLLRASNMVGSQRLASATFGGNGSVKSAKF